MLLRFKREHLIIVSSKTKNTSAADKSHNMRLLCCTKQTLYMMQHRLLRCFKQTLTGFNLEQTGHKR